MKKTTLEQIQKNWRIILVMFVFIISLIIVVAVVYFITSYSYDQRIVECERHIQEHERNLQRSQEVKSWFGEWLSNCERRAMEYYKVLEEHNLLIPD